MKKTTMRKAKKLVVARETVKALTPGALAAVEGGNAVPVPIPITGDSKWVCCA